MIHTPLSPKQRSDSLHSYLTRTRRYHTAMNDPQPLDANGAFLAWLKALQANPVVQQLEMAALTALLGMLTKQQTEKQS